MRYKLLGHSGLRVSELCLGTMTFGEDWGWGASRDESRKVFDRFVERGGNFIDTACNYTEGTSERYVGDFISAERDQFVVATKYTLRPNGANQDDPNWGGNARKNMRRTVEASLRRLNTDYIDLLYLHMWDFTTPVDEVMRAMDDLVRAGKVLYIGFSDSPAWVISYAVALAERHGWTRPIAVQVPYSLRSRAPERAVMPMAQTLDLAVTAWGLLSGGILTGKYYDDDESPKRYSGAPNSMRETVTALQAVASEAGCTPAQAAIAWVRQQSTNIIPIIGARTEQQAIENLDALDVQLDDEQITRINDTVKFRRDFPLDFLASSDVRQLIFGNTWSQIDNHRWQPA